MHEWLGEYARQTMENERWDIERRWEVVEPDKEAEVLLTKDLARYKCVAMLGSAGLGKTVEAEVLAAHERDMGLEVRECRLAEFAGSTTELRDKLLELSENAHDGVSIFVDSLDEVMVPLPRAWATLRQWLQGEFSKTKACVRIMCRPGVWNDEVSSAMKHCAGDNPFGVAMLQQLNDDDVLAAAASMDIDGHEFIKEATQRRVGVLAAQPLTLLMLLRTYKANGQLPPTLSELYRLGTQTLAADQHQRFKLDTQIKLSPDKILLVAEVVACHAVLSGRHRFAVHDTVASDLISWTELEASGTGDVTIDRDAIVALASCGLCTSRSPGEFEFAHRLLSEYLAGRRIARMLTHQSRALLASPAGWSSGVAGPLRETAAFAALESEDIAQWISECDPEVIGLSDVASDDLRKAALDGLFDKLRRTEITDSQVGRGELELSGFRYPKVENDLKPVLLERGNGAEDVLECAIELIDSWRLESLSDELATLMLDDTAPLQARVSAGYVLFKQGTPGSRNRIRCLANGAEHDEKNDLKGLAIECNWPDRITPEELLSFLDVPENAASYGAYHALLWQLDEQRFAAEGCRLAGLAWAKRHFSNLGDTNPAHRIAVRIVHAAVYELDEVKIAEALVSILIECHDSHHFSPFAALARPGYRLDGGEPAQAAPLMGQQRIRRSLMEAIAKYGTNSNYLPFACRRTPGLCEMEDFGWLLEHAVDEGRPQSERDCSVQLARLLPWYQSRLGRRTWRRFRKLKPVTPALDGVVARNPVEWVRLRCGRIRFQASELRFKWKSRSKRVRPSPARGVRIYLKRAEKDDPLFFSRLCNELTLERKSSFYGTNHTVTELKAWKKASSRTRKRITNAAKKFLDSGERFLEDSRKEPLNSILFGGMAAIRLVSDQDPRWIKSRDGDWWDEWCWYILRELRPNMVDEADEPKRVLLRSLQDKAPKSVRREILALLTSNVTGSAELLVDLLRMLDPIVDNDLDEVVQQALSEGKVIEDRFGTACEFVLGRRSGLALPVLLSLLSQTSDESERGRAVEVAIAVLFVCPSEGWDSVARYLESNPDDAVRVLSRFCHGRHMRSRIANKEDSTPMDRLSSTQLAELCAFLFIHFPPESDPNYEGVHTVGPNDSARDARNSLLSALGERDSLSAVEGLKKLEKQFGVKYPWLRRPRARAERNFRLSHWSPVAGSAIIELLGSTQKRLLRSADDVVDGISYALEQYERTLHREGESGVEDLWNTPKGSPPSPKHEEQVSNNICGAVRTYFREYAVCADREAEINRRTVKKEAGGEQGSELDVLVQVAGSGTESGQRIRVPIEVKLSCNNEVKTAMESQLVERYMKQLDTTHGVYVVAWMNAPEKVALAASHKPKWKSFDDAQRELKQQCEDLLKANGVQVTSLVLDAALR